MVLRKAVLIIFPHPGYVHGAFALSWMCEWVEAIPCVVNISSPSAESLREHGTFAPSNSGIPSAENGLPSKIWTSESYCLSTEFSLARKVLAVLNDGLT